MRALPADRVGDAEFQVFSQFGEDGIIQFLVGTRVPIENEVFVEFGVENYAESNTRFLLVHDNWRGLIMDGGESMHGFLDGPGIEVATPHRRQDRVHRPRQHRRADPAAPGSSGDIGLLSVDIDGNDYWVLEAIDVVSAAHPRRSSTTRPSAPRRL